MVKNTEEMLTEHKDRIEAIRELERDLLKENFTIKKEDEFELGGIWHLSYGDYGDSTFEWNVPHYLTLTIKGNTTVDEDYIKSDQDWKDFLENCKSLLLTELKKRNMKIQQLAYTLYDTTDGNLDFITEANDINTLCEDLEYGDVQQGIYVVVDNKIKKQFNLKPDRVVDDKDYYSTPFKTGRVIWLPLLEES